LSFNDSALGGARDTGVISLWFGGQTRILSEFVSIINQTPVGEYDNTSTASESSRRPADSAKAVENSSGGEGDPFQSDFELEFDDLSLSDVSSTTSSSTEDSFRLRAE